MSNTTIPRAPLRNSRRATATEPRPTTARRDPRATGLGSEKITEEHLQRLAIVYVRQSTQQQVLEHRESTARQYALADRAVALGWPAAAVEVIDVPTPATYVRYTGNWKASPDGWYITNENARATPLRALPGLSDLYMVGQWTAPFTGTVMGALTSRQVVQLLCARDGIDFRTTEP